MSTLYYDTLPPAETLPNTALISAPNYQRGLIVAPINIPMPNLSPPPALTQTCVQSDKPNAMRGYVVHINPFDR